MHFLQPLWAAAVSFYKTLWRYQRWSQQHPPTRLGSVPVQQTTVICTGSLKCNSSHPVNINIVQI